MKTFIITLVALFSAFQITAQDLDLNTQKGFVAEGYDVVSYFDNKAIKGSNDYQTSYGGSNFKFSSKENLETFLKDPEAYIPEYGGYCAYAIALKNKKVKIDPETFEIRDNKLYLFYNAWGTNTLELWLENDVKGLQEKGDKNWEAMNF
ncbi:MAG: YHS domain-containing protein [Psychroserpens sp.]|nr:YHS domain-containing protein [Psychroserpens sp.]